MGVVYEAEDMKLGRHVALKMLSGAADAGALERFWREARAASALNHPGICTLFEINESESTPFLVMELLEGQSLDRMYAGKPVPVPRLIELGIQIADALDAAHRKGILHRDIKPGNIFITTAGQTKILDFGLARFDDGGEVSDETVASGISPRNMLTTPGSTLGTIAYMSPEQARGETLDQRSDVFSFGVVLYEMSTGKHPFEGTTTAVVFDKLLNYVPVTPLSINQELPAEFEAILNKALEKDRDIRYQSAADLRADLRRLQRISSASRTMASAVAVSVASSYPGMTRANVPVASAILRGSGGVAVAVPAASTAGAVSSALRSGPQQEISGRGRRTAQQREHFRRILSVATIIVVAFVVASRFLHRTQVVPQVVVVQQAPAANPTPGDTSAVTATPEAKPSAATDAAPAEAAAVVPAAATSKPAATAKPAATRTATHPVPAQAPAPVAPPVTTAPAATTATPAPPPPSKPASAPVSAIHPVFATVSYPAHHVHSFPFLSGRSSDGTLQLSDNLLTFNSPSDPISLTRAQVRSVDGATVIDSAGRKYRFQIDGMSNDQAHELLTKWFASNAPSHPASN